ncbi:MAG: hypothetical protein ACXAC6_12565 [Candidatus Hodarchaeales archaeon]|jgi:hypothetical protein
MYDTKPKIEFKANLNKILTKKTVIFIVHATIAWALCGATMKIGMGITSVDNALIIHAIAAPIIFCAISLFYYQRFNYTTPLLTAIGFTGFTIAMDFFIVAPIFEQSYAMFYSLLGTWIPFLLMFLSTYFTGVLMTRLLSK